MSRQERIKTKAGRLPGDSMPLKPPFGGACRETAVSAGPSEIRGKKAKKRGLAGRRRNSTPQEAF